jgi:hypothetical protein
MAVALDRRYRFTVDQYHRMAEAGIFDADCRVELVDGVIFEMTPVDPWHPALWTGDPDSSLRSVAARGARTEPRGLAPVGTTADIMLCAPARILPHGASGARARLASWRWPIRLAP